jgi:Flp pilus assembly protein TadD
MVLHVARRHGEAVMHLERAIEGEPNLGLHHHFLGLALTALGEHARARTALERAMELSGRSPEIIAALCCAVSGDAARVTKLSAELRGLAETRYVSPCLLAMIELARGERERALAELERAVEFRAAELLWLGVRPEWDSIRGDSRFTGVMNRVGLSSHAPS